VIISPLTRTWPFNWTNLNSLHPRIIWTKFDWFFGLLVQENIFFQIFSAFVLFCYYLPLERDDPLHLNKLDDLCRVWLELDPVILENTIFKWPYPIFVSISPLKRTWPFIWTNLNSLPPRIICIKFDWIWPAGSGEEDFKNLSAYFYSFAIISHGEWLSLSNPHHPRIICVKSG
jgi:hypothetical protein